MQKLILEYKEVRSNIETFNTFSFEEVDRLYELGLIELDSELLIIYNYAKHGSPGYLDLRGISLTYLSNWLTMVTAALDIRFSNIEDIPDSLKIKGSIFASWSKLKEFRRSEVFGNLYVGHTQISKLPDNLKVYRHLRVEGIQFEQFPKNLKISGDLYISNSNLEQFSDEELREMYKIKGHIYRDNEELHIKI